MFFAVIKISVRTEDNGDNSDKSNDHISSVKSEKIVDFLGSSGQFAPLRIALLV
ncbi:hypothetical protein D3C81_1878090 [compost metagenome]